MARRFKGKPGDQIEISRDEVVHLVPDGGQSFGSFASLSSRAEVKREKLTDVVGNDSYQLNNLLDDSRTACEPNVIEKEAFEMVDHKLPYDLDNKNCEHFAIEMRYGKAESRQFKGKPGDLIEINRVTYQHWAVYIGENEVVHLVPEGDQSSGSSANSSSSNGKVKCEKLTDVVGNHRYQVNNLLDDLYDARDTSSMVKEARAMVGRVLQYDLVTYNSEHFASEMRYGKAKSRQFKGKPGDLIQILRGSYQHWAVYISKDEVVHFTTDGDQLSGLFKSLSRSTGTVKREKLTDVVGHHRFKVNNLLDEEYKARDPSIIVKEARAMVADKPQYDLVTYNCEHFAIEMRYGKAESRQFKGKPGDLIQIFRGSYQHWAVYIGEDEVVHFTTDGGLLSGLFKSLSRSTGTVKREMLTDVVGHHRFKVNNLLDEEYKARDPSIIVKKACEMVDRVLKYDLVKFNCEHFATEMRYGVAESRQFNGKPGDLIEINCGPYQQWAVYIGENEVVHFTTDGGQSSGSSGNMSSSRGEVKCEKFTDVVKEYRHQVNNLLDDLYKSRDPSIIVKEACEKVGSKPQYNLVTYNCEHFATDLRYGVAESRQFKGIPGDLIEIFRKNYQHWAVYIGENEVVHLVPEGGDSSGSSANLISGNVKREKLTDVVGNDRYQVSNLLDEEYKARDPDDIVKEACAMVGHKQLYSLVTNNCEHFATKMRYGVAESRQVFKGFIKCAKDLGASAASASSSSK